MPQGRRKPTSRDVDRVNDNLEVISKAVDDAKTYIAKHPWDKEKPEDMARAFDFISKLIDKIYGEEWDHGCIQECQQCPEEGT